MKKWSIFFVILLLAGLYALKMATRDSGDASPAGAAPAAGIPVPSGVELPKDSTDYYYHPTELPPRASSSYGALPTNGLDTGDKEFCKGVNLNRILSDHGKLWGYTAQTSAFSQAETNKLYDLLSSYFACYGLAIKDPYKCDYLPGEGEKISYFSSPNYACRAKYTEIAFGSFMAGNKDAEMSCDMFLTGAVLKNGPQIPKREFCAASASGLENVCSGIQKYLPGDFMEKCLTVFPAKKSDCHGDAECLNRMVVYAAMKAGKSAACPKEDSALCAAYLNKSPSSCSGLLNTVGSAYCSMLSAANKRTGGYAGYTPQELKAALLADAEKKKQEQQAELEMKALQVEVNKRAKELMKKTED